MLKINSFHALNYYEYTAMYTLLCVYAVYVSLSVHDSN